MNCYNCGKKLLPDSDYCSYCGVHIEELPDKNFCGACRNELPEDSQFCPYCGAGVESKSNNIREKERKQSKLPKWKTIIAVFIISTFMFGAGYGIGQQKAIKLKKNYDELSKSLETAEIDLKNSSNKASKYNAIRNFLNSPNPGFSSDNFFVNRPIVILNVSTTNGTSVKLTCGFSASVEITTHFEGSSADVEFSEPYWYGDETQLRIVPISKGITNITFTNSYNSQKFNMLVIVE